MKQKIAIMGSTGSIGKNLIKILKTNKKKFEISLLTTNKDYKNLLKQVKMFNVKNVIIIDKKSYLIFKKKNKNSKINIFNNFNNLEKIFKKKIDYVMSAITGIEGLYPTLKIIKYTKKIAIANKESIICGWGLIKNELKKYNTNFIPVDSEHFSLWYALKNINPDNIERIFITASGGPLYKIPLVKFKNIKIKQVLNHPNWTMGKKISVDSATMINKIFEVIEAKNIFEIPYNKIQILIHPKSYIHAMIKSKGGLIKIVAHDTTMRIPIFNSLFFNTKKTLKTKSINMKILNDLQLSNISQKRYPMIKLLNFIPDKNSLYETVIVSANDTLVDLFLKKKIKFLDIHKYLFKLINSKKFLIYKKIYAKNIRDIIELNDYVRLNIIKKVYKS